MENMTRYELFKFLHVTGAIVWLGGGVGLTILWSGLTKAKEADAIRAIGTQNKALSAKVFGPAVLLTLAFGVAMVIDTPAFAFSDFWIISGFIGIGFSGAINGAVADPATKRLVAAIESDGFDSTAAAAARAKVRLAGNLEMLVLFAVVFVMVAKPGL
jgi:uncharacterized membrane protein